PTAAPRPNTSASATATERPRGDAADRHDAQRLADVAALLRRRAAAVRNHDRAAFAATIDPRSTAFRAKQLAVFDALREVPLGSWEYEIDPEGDVPPSSPFLAKYGVEAWSPRTTLRYQLRGFDPAPTQVEQFFTFVLRDGHWLTANDADFPGTDRQTARDLWDFGPVRVVRGARSLVLGHPGHAALLRDIAAQADAAVPRVSAVWGTDWAQRAVLVVPDTQREVAAILGDDSDLSRIAAVAVAELPQDTGARHPVGNRVIVNPPNFRRLGPNGRRVVVTHEITHVATRQASGPGVPTWLVEGFADYVGYLGTGLSARAICQELRTDVRAGRVPASLPKDPEFDGANPRLAQAYEAGWLATRLIAERTGRAGLVAFYRRIGAVTTGDPLRTALRDALHTTPETFTAAWRTYVRNELG
ncbi:MAG: hypothetical protein QOE45_3409, partial [Frankiaceae bacterium]|nr:hypothetical protein [Frankiaceae bacterium]